MNRQRANSVAHGNGNHPANTPSHSSSVEIGNVRGDLKALLANLLTAASQGHSSELLGWTFPLGACFRCTL